MAHRVMELTLVSASDLKDVNTFSDMEVYAVASVSSDPLTRQRTRTDRCGGTDPSWDHHTHRFTVPPTAAAAAASGATLRVLLRTERFFGDDRDVGEVVVPLADILAGACASGAATPPQCASFRVRKVHGSSTEHRGKLRVSFRLGPVVAPLTMPMPPGHGYGYGDGPYYNRPPPPYYRQYYGYPPPSYYGGYPLAPYQGAPPSRYPPSYQGAPPAPYARTLPPRRKDSGSDYLGLLEGFRGGIGAMFFGGDMRMLSSSSDTKLSPAAAPAAYDAGHEAATATDGAGRAAAQKI